MPLSPGTPFGPYKVWLNVLPDAVARDDDRLARFEREAYVLAALNHPHIAAIYGVAENKGVTALVLELVEGPTLQQRKRVVHVVLNWTPRRAPGT